MVFSVDESIVLMVFAVDVKHSPYGLCRGPYRLCRGRKHSPYGFCRGRKA